MTLDTPNEPGPETETEHPEFPPIEYGRITIILRNLIVQALHDHKMDDQDAVEAMRFLDAE